MSRSAYDLTAAVSVLSGVEAAAELCKLIKRFEAAASVAVDLSETKSSLQELTRLKNKKMTAKNSALMTALITHAVICYSRATHTKPISRFNVNVVKYYNDRQKNIHSQLIRLRDKFIAHYGSGMGEWFEEHAILLDFDNCFALTTVYLRTKSQDDLVKTASELVDFALYKVKMHEKAQADALYAYLKDMPDDLKQEISKYKFNEKEFYSGAEGAAEEFWSISPGAQSYHVKR